MLGDLVKHGGRDRHLPPSLRILRTNIKSEALAVNALFGGRLNGVVRVERRHSFKLATLNSLLILFFDLF